MSLKSVFFAVIAVVTVAYPFVVYFSLNTFGVAPLALVLFLIMLIRVIVRGEYKQPEQYAQLILVGGLCVVAAWFNSETLLRYYPVMMNLAFAGFFAISLSTDRPLVERFASIFMNEIPEEGRSYMRTLTKVWAFILLINAGIAFYTACCLSLKAWTLYNGLLAYLFLGGFMLLEYAYRCVYIKRNEA